MDYYYIVDIMVGGNLLVGSRSDDVVPFVPNRADIIKVGSDKFRVMEREIEYFVPKGMHIVVYAEKV